MAKRRIYLQPQMEKNYFVISDVMSVSTEGPGVKVEFDSDLWGEGGQR